MKFLYADTDNGVIESSKKIEASDIVNDEEFLDNVDFYDDEKLFFDMLPTCEDGEILACNCISDEMYKKIDKDFGIHS